MSNMNFIASNSGMSNPRAPCRSAYGFKWYVGFYALMRHDDLIRVPLSAAQIKFLNAPMPLGGVGPAASVALFNAVHQNLGATINLADPNQLASAVYWWVMEYAPERRLDDRLVTPEQIALLRSECQWHGEPFALTILMREYHNRHVYLHYLSMGDPRDRAALLNYLLLLSYSKPIIARLLSRDHVQRALQSTTEGLSAFQQVIGRVVFADATSPEAKKLIEQGNETLKAYGFSFKSGWVQPRTRHGDTGDCFATLRSLDGPIEDGVALIGPIASTSGLGQATRLSLGSLSACEGVPPDRHPVHPR